MKSFIFTFILLVAPASYATSLGQKIDIYSETGGPRFSTIFSYDADKLWMLTMSIWGRDLTPNNLMKTVAWRLFDSKSGQYIDQWKIAVNNTEPVIYPGIVSFSLGLNDSSEILAAIKSLPTLKLVIAVDQDLSAPVPTHHVDLGSLCTSSPQNFVDLTSGGTGCRAKSPGAKLNTF